MDDLKNAGVIAANLGLTKRSLREIAALASILERGPTFAELACQHSVLCQIGLPRRKVEGDHFLRVAPTSVLKYNIRPAGAL